MRSMLTLVVCLPTSSPIRFLRGGTSVNKSLLACAVVLLLPSLMFADDFQRGKEALDKGDYGLAISSFTACIRENPRSAAAYYNRGLAYANKEEHEKAIEDFTQAVRLNPKYAEA
jgi:tetratricopeptide (TPR) repeat protein